MSTLTNTTDHAYTVTVTWTGNRGTGTSAYREYDRAHEVSALGKPVLPGSSDPAFQGDRARYNPEEMLVASLSSCHMLWYLHLCSEAGIRVLEYVDCAEGVMQEARTGEGRFVEVVLQPDVLLAPGADRLRARALHEDAHRKCFIANSVNFLVRHDPLIRVAEGTPATACDG